MMDKNFELLLGDACERLDNIEDNSIDLVVTSPPYDNLRKYNGTGDSWTHSKFQCIAKNLARVLKPGGVIVWVVNDKTEKGSKSGTSFRQALYFMEIGLNLNDTMIWRKTNPMPQVKQSRYSSCFEYMFVFSKGVPKTFNPIMRECKLGGKLYDSTAKNMDGESGRHKLTYNVNKEMVDYNIWDIAVAQNKTSHPAVYPIEIPLKHIQSWSNEGDIVLDPFMGSGTTGLAALELNRKFVGIEMNNEYFELSKQRILEKSSK
jgi:site-specific DNA-methyltransferase (adenine-specific)